MTNRAIGEQLHLAEKTIKHYMTNILQKLQVRSRVEAAPAGPTTFLASKSGAGGWGLGGVVITGQGAGQCGSNGCPLGQAGCRL